MKILATPSQVFDAGELSEIPPDIAQTHLVPWAHPEYRKYFFGAVLDQTFVHKYYTINIYHCEVHQESIVYASFDEPTIALLVFMEGALKSVNSDGSEGAELQSGVYSIVYVPAGVHAVQVNKGIIRVCMVHFDKDYLAELTEGWPMQQQLMDMLNLSRETGAPFPPAPLTYESVAEIMRMHSSDKKDYLLVIELKSCITKLMGSYLTAIADISYLYNLPDIPHKQLLIRIRKSILANANINKNSIAALAKENNLHEKTLSRNFAALFGTGLSQFMREQCMKQAYYMVTSTNMPLKDIAEQLGYSVFSNFNRAFRLYFKRSPQSLRSVDTNRK